MSSELPTINSPIIDQLSKDAITNLEKGIAQGMFTTIEDVRNYVYETFTSFFDIMSSPLFSTTEYSQYEYKNPLIWNANLFSITRNFDLLYKELISTMELTVVQNDLLSASALNVEQDINSLSNDINDLENQLEQQQFFNKGKTLITISDDFSTITKLDLTRIEAIPNIIFGFGIELPVDSDINRASNIKDVIITTSSILAEDTSLHDEDKLPIRPKPYEGKRFGTATNARPEGGAWRIENKAITLETGSPKLLKDKIYTNLRDPAQILPSNQSILIEGAGTTVSLPIDITTYEIFKDGVSIDTGAKSVSFKNATGNEINNWTTANDISRTWDASTDTSIYTAVGTTVTTTSPTTSTGQFGIDPSIANKSIIQQNERFDDRHPDDVGYIASDPNNASVTQSDQFAKTLTRADFSYVETSASKEDLLAKQMSMFDNKLDTFWEVEYTPVVSSIEQAIISNVDAATTVSGKQSAYANAQSIALASATSLTNDGVLVTIEVVFDAPRTVNYITLDPFLFGDLRTSNYEITNLEIQPKDGDPFKTIPGFSTEFSNVMSIDSNITLSNKHLSRTGGKNKFSNKGKGVWTLESSTILKRIRVSIKQTVAIPNPYPLKNIQLLRKVSKSISESKSRSSGSVSGFKTNNSSASGSGDILERGRFTQWIEFGYLETIADSLTSGANTSLLAGSTSGDNTATSNSNQNSFDNTSSTGGVFGLIGGAVGTNIPIISGSLDQAVTVSSVIAGALITAAGSALDSALSGGSSGATSGSSSSQFNDSGYQVNKQWFKTVWGRVRYAIGIRELSFRAKTFKLLSEVESIEYEILAKGKEITLEVSRFIPSAFTSYNNSVAWIEYYIKVDDKPYRIQPIIGEAVQTSAGQSISSQILLDTVTSNEKVKIRFYARILRPSSEELDNAEALSPILHKYKINIIGF